MPDRVVAALELLASQQVGAAPLYGCAGKRTPPGPIKPG
jgi:hypothetical protein